jgi:glycosyltransferase involved in cell wall biosynthesis
MQSVQLERTALFDEHAHEGSRAAAREPSQCRPAIELTILMPCLNEARTLATCITKARCFLARAGVNGEVVIADNGSTDGSQAIAEGAGARVVNVPVRGYGAALIAGINAAQGRFVIMGDSDDSYDFGALDPFVDALRAGNQLVVGNRFRGGIGPGAMPLLHRYLGNPVLSFLGRRFFGGELSDFHCGLRGFDRDAIRGLHLVTPGMEFASEMIVKSLQARLRVCEVPTRLNKDGRDRPPHLNTWRDGWRHLRYLLLYSPRWLFLYPGALLATLGVLQLAASAVWEQGRIPWPLGIHTQLFASAALVLGYQTLLFAMGAVLARHLAGLDAPHPREQWARRMAGSLWLPLGGAVATFAGASVCVGLAVQWGADNFGSLNPEVEMRRIIPAVALVIIGTQSLLASMYFAALRSAFDSIRSVNPTRPA